MNKNLSFFLALFLIIFGLTACDQPASSPAVEKKVTAVTDPLPSWHESASKKSIIDFVKAVSDENSADFVPPEERIATFDNDGTLWSEQPLYFQLLFALDQIREMAPEHPEWKTTQPYKAVLENDQETLLEAGTKGLVKIMMTSHTGMSTTEFEQLVQKWINTAKHPKTGKLYKEMIYQPMLEVLDFLRENQFKVFIVSGGGIEFMRPWTQEVYGIPSEQVVGSSVKVALEMTEQGPILKRLPEINFIDDKEGKPVGIHQHIGKRPIAAFGNSDGDLQMLQWTDTGEGKRLMVFIHHTDEAREWAYDRESHIGKFDKGLDEANAKGWTVVNMKNEWKIIYPFELN